MRENLLEAVPLPGIHHHDVTNEVFGGHGDVAPDVFVRVEGEVAVHDGPHQLQLVVVEERKASRESHE